MQNEYIEKWQNMGQDSFRAYKELEAMGLKTAEQLTAQNMALISAWADAGARQLTAFKTPKDYQELVSQQLALASDVTASMVDNARKTADILNDARTELTAWVERKVGENVPAAAAKSDYTGGTPAQRAA